MNRQAYKDTARQGILTEAEVGRAPMHASHKELVLQHYHRLLRVAAEHDVGAIGRYTTKLAAREQLARMTLVVRDYLWRQARGDFVEDDDVESMVVDVVDASFFVSGREGTFAQPAFVNPLLFGREQEIVALMQEWSAQGTDDVIELWNLRMQAGEKVLPDGGPPGEDMGAEIGWDYVLRRSVSENDVLYRAQKAEKGTDCQEYPLKSRGRSVRRLLRRVDSSKTLAWPPAGGCLMIPSRRSRAGTGLSAIPSSSSSDYGSPG